VSPRPVIFISAVSKELKSARQLVANTLQFLGYDPVWEDNFNTEQGDIREILRRKIDECEGVVQIVGQCHGTALAVPDEVFGPVSYTQYEALYARSQGRKVWYLVLDDTFPGDPHAEEPEELRKAQAAYRARLQGENHLFHPLNSPEGLEASVLKLRDDLARLRRGVKQWAYGVLALLLVILAAVAWLKTGQRKQDAELVKLHAAMLQFSEVQTRERQGNPKQSAEELERRSYETLAKKLGVDAKTLQEKLPQFAKELQTAPDTTPFERANAAFVAKNYLEAERLALVAAAAAMQAAPPTTNDAINAYELAGNAAMARIDYATARRHYQASVQLTDRARDSFQWAGQQWNLAHVLDKQGQYAASGKTYQGALEEYRRTKGEEDADVLSLRRHLANSLNFQGKYAEAEAEHRAVIKLREKVLGAEHPDTLLSRMNLANALFAQGKHAEAEAEYRAVLKLMEKVLGTEHPDTLMTRNNLANALCFQGKYAEAEAEHRAVLTLQEKVLGAEHPDTLMSRMNLANALYYQGKYAEAEAEYRATIKAKEKVLGAEHPDTLATRNNLARALDSLGKHAEAEAEHRAVMKLREKVLGAEHPDTLMSRMNLALALNAQGKYAEAEAEYRAVAKLQEKVLGAEHPDTLASRINLVNALYSQGKYAEAEAACRAVLTSAEKVLGAEHPDTLLSRMNLANALNDQGKHIEAEAEYRAVLKLMEKVLGTGHPNTLLSCYNLALCLKAQGKLAEAKVFARRAAESGVKVLGANHPITKDYQKLWQQLQ
jgi:hypothetical protein